MKQVSHENQINGSAFDEEEGILSGFRGTHNRNWRARECVIKGLRAILSLQSADLANVYPVIQKLRIYGSVAL